MPECPKTRRYVPTRRVSESVTVAIAGPPVDATDWDHSKVRLLGLGTVVDLEAGRKALKDAKFEPLPEDEVQVELKTIAAYLTNHESVTEVWKGTVSGLNRFQSAMAVNAKC
jgi:hypothetical protein